MDRHGCFGIVGIEAVQSVTETSLGASHASHGVQIGFGLLVKLRAVLFEHFEVSDFFLELAIVCLVCGVGDSTGGALAVHEWISRALAITEYAPI